MATAGRVLAETVQSAWNAAAPATGTPLAVRTARVALPGATLSLRHCVARWLPAARIPLGRTLPSETELIAVALGPVAWVTIPGEAVSALGREIRDAVRERWTQVVIAGVSNDYLGYFIRPQDEGRTSYVTCAAVYGARLGPCLAATATELLRQLPPRDANASVGASSAVGGASNAPVAACDFTTAAR